MTPVYTTSCSATGNGHALSNDPVHRGDAESAEEASVFRLPGDDGNRNAFHPAGQDRACSPSGRSLCPIAVSRSGKEQDLRVLRVSAVDTIPNRTPSPPHTPILHLGVTGVRGIPPICFFYIRQDLRNQSEDRSKVQRPPNWNSRDSRQGQWSFMDLR